MLNLVQASHERRRLQDSCPKRGKTDLRTGNTGKKYGDGKDEKALLGSEDAVPLPLCTLVQTRRSVHELLLGYQGCLWMSFDWGIRDQLLRT